MQGGSKLRDDETDTADDVVGWRFVRFERKQLNREGKRERAEDEPPIVEFEIAEDEAGAATDGIEGALVGAVGRKRVVMAIKDDDGTVGDAGVHGGSLLRVGAHGEEALPVGALHGWTGAIFLEAGRKDVNGLNDRSGPNPGFVHRR
jgi:hypothetical protein